jgi:ATP adenylyltransferase
MSDGACPFCAPDEARVFHRGEHVVGLWDAFPVAEGHALLVTRRHVASWFDATPAEQQELVRAVEIARAVIRGSLRPDGL